MALNRLEIVDLVESLKFHYSDDEKAQAVIDAATDLIHYYDKHGWPNENKK